MKFIIAALCALTCGAATAEDRVYRDVYLSGLSRDGSWPYNPAGQDSAMVCNVNGPDGFLSVRAGPGTDYAVRRNLKRIAIVRIDTTRRKGHWVKVDTAYRSHSVDGDLLAEMRDLHVEGWAHDGYLCDFLD